MQATLKRASGVLGVWLTLACIGFVLWRMTELLPQMRQHADWPTLLAGLALSTAIYSSACLALALAWWLLLRTFASPHISLSAATQGHLRAQLAKYLPGNIFHFAARHVHARASGLGHGKTAYSAIAESMMLVMVAALLSASIPSEALPALLQNFTAWRWPLVALIALGVGGGILFLSSRQTLPSERMASKLAGVGKLMAVALCYLFFFLAAAVSFKANLGVHSVPLQALVPVVAICWLGGFLVIGAPAGLGVREALFLGLLGPLVGDANAILAALVFRGATILADVLMSLLGQWIGPHTS